MFPSFLLPSFLHFLFSPSKFSYLFIAFKQTIQYRWAIWCSYKQRTHFSSLRIILRVSLLVFWNSKQSTWILFSFSCLMFWVQIQRFMSSFISAKLSSIIYCITVFSLFLLFWDIEPFEFVPFLYIFCFLHSLKELLNFIWKPYYYLTIDTFTLYETFLV